MNTLSPLRYPGGKTCLHSTMASIISLNNLVGGHYFESHAGGCGLALSLLKSGHVSKLILNDLDRSIYAFWKIILTESEEFIQKIWETPINLDERDRQSKIQKEKMTTNLFELAFSTFFLNRVNYSGVIQGGILGGKKQAGRYKMGSRFNKKGLIEKIRWIASNRHRIYFFNMDALDFMKKHSTTSNSLFYIDPPYFHKGHTLYSNYYQSEDHNNVARFLQSLSIPWVLTYDDRLEVKTLYRNYQQYQFNSFNNVGNRRFAMELLIANNIEIPPILNLSLVSK